MIRLRSILGPLNLTSARALKDVTKIADQSVRRQASRALIMRHYDRLGDLHGRMGVPMGDVRLHAWRARQAFSGGTIGLQGNDTVGQNQSMPFNWNADQEKWLNPRRIVETPPFRDS
jgi:hypothetical protein